MRSAAAFSRCFMRVSIITLPTKKIFESSTPSRFRFVVGVAARCEEDRRESVRYDSVGLFRHGAIKTAQTGLDMRHWYEEFRCDDRARHCGIHVADHKHQVRLFLQTDFLELHHDARRLFSVRAGAYAEVHIWNGNTKSRKKTSDIPSP